MRQKTQSLIRAYACPTNRPPLACFSHALCQQARTENTWKETIAQVMAWEKTQRSRTNHMPRQAKWGSMSAWALIPSFRAPLHNPNEQEVPDRSARSHGATQKKQRKPHPVCRNDRQTSFHILTLSAIVFSSQKLSYIALEYPFSTCCLCLRLRKIPQTRFFFKRSPSWVLPTVENSRAQIAPSKMDEWFCKNMIPWYFDNLF
jgi:hypothetical protein